MFTAERPKYQYMVENELENSLRVLQSHPNNSEEYAKTLSHVERLHHLMERPSSGVSKETMLTVGANLLGILMIIKHEHVGNFISSKALGFVLRVK